MSRRRRPIVGLSLLGVLALASVCCSRPVTPPAPDRALDAAAARPPSAAKAKKRALLVGINDYKYNDITDLRGCLRDVDNMKEVLIKHFGFDPAAIVTLRDHEATLHGITKRFEQHLIEGADADTVAVFYYSGHGSQMFDRDGDELDGWDETLVTHDSGRLPGHENRDLSDDKLNQLLGQLNAKTKRVTMILDSCHSGTAARAGGQPKAAPCDARGIPAAGMALADPCQWRPDAPASRGVSEGTSGVRPTDMRYTLISGARTDEYSYERVIGDQPTGALTWFLTDALRKARPGATYRDVMDRVKLDVSAMFPAQHPQLEGAAQDDLVFGAARQPLEPFTDAVKKGGHFELAAGRAHGVTADSVYALYHADAKTFPPGGEALRAKVVRVDDLTAELAPVGAGSELPGRARAVEREHHYVGKPIEVSFRDQARSDIVKEVRRKLADYAIVHEAASERDYDLSVGPVADRSGAIVVEAGTPDAISPPIPKGPGAVDEAVRVVLAWARWHSLRAIENPAAQQLPLELSLTLPAAPGEYDPNQLSGRLHAGEQFQVMLNNKTDQKWFVYLLDLSGDGSVSLLYPPAGANESIAPHTSWQKTLKACTPAGRTTPVRDVLKVFFTNTPADFSFLRQGALTRGQSESVGSRDASSALSALLGTAAGVRGAMAVDNDPTTWATRQFAFEVVPIANGGICQ